jgi:hypothetical protein
VRARRLAGPLGRVADQIIASVAAAPASLSSCEKEQEMNHFRTERLVLSYLSLSFIGSYYCVAANEDTISVGLSGFEEVPVIFTTSSGVFNGTITRESIDYTLSYSVLQSNASVGRLQFGQRGVEGA